MREPITLFDAFLPGNGTPLETRLEILDKKIYQLELELNDFYNDHIRSTDITSILAIERRGFHLFYPYIMNKNHEISRAKKYETTELIRISHNGRSKKPYDIILTDAVKSGSELSLINKFIITENKNNGNCHHVSKICGYLGVNKAVKELKQQFPDQEFIFKKIVQSIEEYKEEQKILQHIYQHRLIPIDGDIPYIVLRLSERFEFDKLMSVIKNAISQKYKYEIEDGNPEQSTLKYNATSLVLKSNLDFILTNKIEKEFFSDCIDEIKFRIRFCPDNNEVCIAAILASELPILKISENIREKEICRDRKISICRSLLLSTTNRNTNTHKANICLHCFSYNHGIELLDDLIKQLHYGNNCPKFEIIHRDLLYVDWKNLLK
jgi:hypothetical protein